MCAVWSDPSLVWKILTSKKLQSFSRNNKVSSSDNQLISLNNSPTNTSRIVSRSNRRISRNTIPDLLPTSLEQSFVRLRLVRSFHSFLLLELHSDSPTTKQRPEPVVR